MQLKSWEFSAQLLWNRQVLETTTDYGKRIECLQF